MSQTAQAREERLIADLVDARHGRVLAAAHHHTL
jgi:hypothetical protein